MRVERIGGDYRQVSTTHAEQAEAARWGGLTGRIPTDYERDLQRLYPPTAAQQTRWIEASVMLSDMQARRMQAERREAELESHPIVGPLRRLARWIGGTSY